MIRACTILLLFGALAAEESNIRIDFHGQAQRQGPVLVAVSATAPGAEPHVQGPPYLIVVTLGKEVRYVYPANAIFPGVTDQQKAANHWWRALFRFQNEVSYPDELSVEAIFADGTRVSRTERVPYVVPKNRIDMATAYQRDMATVTREMEKRVNAPDYPDRSRDLCLSYGLLLGTTLDRDLASRIWSEARALIGPTGSLTPEFLQRLDLLQLHQLSGAIKRNDLALQRTLITERERLGFEVKAYHYMSLMTEMVNLENDVEGAWQMWPKLVESYRRNPDGHSQSYADYVIQDPRLPRQRIDPSGRRDPTKLSLSAKLIDEDEFTPADRARIELQLESGAAAHDLEEVSIILEVTGEPATSKPTAGLLLHASGDPSPSVRLRVGQLPAGAIVSLEATITSATEDNGWIFDRLVAADEVDDHKPENERSVALGSCLRVRVEGRRAGGAQAVIVDEELTISNADGSAAEIVYPDLRERAGVPPDHESLEYYRVGDPDYTRSGQRWVRAVALRAARYDHETRSSDGSQMPENDVEAVVRNMAWFVHDTFQPKNWPEPIWNSMEIAREVRNGVLDPSKRFQFAGREGMACIEHAYFFGALLRAAGIPAREINCLAYPIAWSYADQFFQDASSEAYYKAAAESSPRWHYFSLYTASGHPIEDPGERYASRWNVFELWVGTRSWNLVGTGRQNRFLMRASEMQSSKVWMPYGYGGAAIVSGEGFFKRSDEPWGWKGWLTSYWSFRFFSPVAARVELADGRSVGATGEVDHVDVARWYAQGEEGTSPPGFVSEVPGAFYFPQGALLPDGSATRDAATAMAQTIVLPAAAAEAGFTLDLVGTGTGPFRVECQHVTSEGVQPYVDITGDARPGSRATYARDFLQPTGPRRPPMLPGAAATSPPSETLPGQNDPPAPATTGQIPAPPPVAATRTPAASAEGEQTPRPAWLGAAVVDPEGATAGTLVTQVVDESPAGKGGLMPGDLITHVNRTTVRDTAHLLELIAAARSGDRLDLGIIRAGTLARAAVVLEARPREQGAPPIVQSRQPTGPTIGIQKVWMQHDVLSADGDGLIVYGHVVASGFRGQELEFIATFEDASGRALQGSHTYATTGGDAVASVRAVSAFEDSEWKELAIFMPYWALNLASGARHQARVILHARLPGRPQALASSEPVDFQVTRPVSPIAVMIQNTDVHHDERNFLEVGLAFIVDFEVHGRRGKTISLMVSFTSASGQTLRDTNGRYTTTDGEVAALQEVTPTLDATAVTDARLYIPYSELHLPRGTHDLSYVIHLYDHHLSRFAAATHPARIRVTVP